MADARETPDEPVVTDDVHPTAPAEGPREPGEDADASRPPRPQAPAEGER